MLQVHLRKGKLMTRAHQLLKVQRRKKSTTNSAKEQNNSPTTPTLRSQSAKKGGEIATPMTDYPKRKQNKTIYYN
jgi:hypothetical protein